MAVNFNKIFYTKIGRVTKSLSHAAYYSVSYDDVLLIKKGRLKGSSKEKERQIEKYARTKLNKILNLYSNFNKFYNIETLAYSKNKKIIKDFDPSSNEFFKNVKFIRLKWHGKFITPYIKFDTNSPTQKFIETNNFVSTLRKGMIKKYEPQRMSFVGDTDLMISKSKEKLNKTPIKNLRIIKKKGVKTLERPYPFAFADVIYKYDNNSSWYDKYRFSNIVRSLHFNDSYMKVIQEYMVFKNLDLKNGIDYILGDRTDKEKIISEFNEGIRTNIRKNKKRNKSERTLDELLNDKLSNDLDRLKKLTKPHIEKFWDSIKNRDIKNIFGRISILIRDSDGSTKTEGFAIQMLKNTKDKDIINRFKKSQKTFDSYFNALFKKASLGINRYLKGGVNYDGPFLEDRTIEITGLSIRSYEEAKSKKDKHTISIMEKERLEKERIRSAKYRLKRKVKRNEKNKKHITKSSKTRKRKK